MSPSSSVRRHRETPIATATRARLAATSPRLTSIRPRRISLPALEQLCGRPLLDHPPGLDPDQPLRHPARLREIVGDEDDRDAEPPAELEEGRLDRVAGRLVERRRRLVEEQHPRLERQRAGQHRPLLFADREPRRIALGEGAVQAGELEHPDDVGLVAVAPTLGGEADVVGDRAVEQRRKLWHQADLPAQPEHLTLADVAALIEHPAPVGVGEPVEQPQQGRLAAPRRSGDTARARRQPRVQIAQDRLAAAREADLLELERTALSAAPQRLSSACRRRDDAALARADAGDGGEAPPGGEGWAFELKWDGVRALAFAEPAGCG